MKEQTDLEAINLISSALLQIIEHHRSTYADDKNSLFGLNITTVIELESSLRHPNNMNLKDWESTLRSIASCSDELDIDVENLMRGLVRFRHACEHPN
jgi:hypothetical protein